MPPQGSAPASDFTTVPPRALKLTQGRAGLQRAPLLAACVIEDMDLIVRGGPSPRDNDLTPEQRHHLQTFASEDGRSFKSWDAAREALLAWYGEAAWVDSWKGNRVRQVGDGSWWSDINPLARRLAQSGTELPPLVI